MSFLIQSGILVDQINQILIQALKNKRLSLNESKLIKFIGNLIAVSHGYLNNNGKPIDPNTAQGQESIRKIATTFIESVKIYKALKSIDQFYFGGQTVPVISKIKL